MANGAAGQIGALYVDIAARLGNLEKGFAQAQSRAAQAGGQIAASLTGTLTRVLGAAAIGAGFANAIKGASDLNATVSKTNVIFGDAAGAIFRQADAMASSFGTVRTEYLNAAASFGAVFKGVGKTQAEAADLGNTLAKLGMDLASFEGTATNQEAFTAIAAALRGEFDTIEKFRVFLTADAVAAEALASGLARNRKEIDETARKMAVLNLIFRQTRDQQGDLERTAGESDNQFKKFTGTLQNLSDTFGLTVLPAITTGVSLLNEGLSKLAGGFDRTKGSVEGFGSTASQWLDAVGFAFRNLGDLWTIASLQIQEGGENVINAFAVLPENLSRIAHYIADNWRALIVDAINAVITAFRNLQDNLAKLADAIVTWLLDPTKGFQAPDWTPLLTSFRATAEQLPELLQPQLVSMQSRIDEIFARIGEREAERARELARAAAAAGPPRPPGGGAGAPGGGVATPEKRATITGVEEFAKGLLSSAFGTAGVAEKQLAAQQKTATVSEQHTEILNTIRDHLASIVSRGGGAVATKPA